MAIARVFLRPAIGCAEQWKHGRWHEKRMPLKMAAFQVPKFVSHVEANRIRMMLQGIHHVSEQHDKAPAEEARSQRIERVHPQHIALRNWVKLEFLAPSSQMGINVRILLWRHLNAGAFDVRNKGTITNMGAELGATTSIFPL